MAFESLAQIARLLQDPEDQYRRVRQFDPYTAFRRGDPTEDPSYISGPIETHVPAAEDKIGNIRMLLGGRDITEEAGALTGGFGRPRGERRSGGGFSIGGDLGGDYDGPHAGSDEGILGTAMTRALVTNGPASELAGLGRSISELRSGRADEMTARGILDGAALAAKKARLDIEANTPGEDGLTPRQRHEINLAKLRGQTSTDVAEIRANAPGKRSDLDTLLSNARGDETGFAEGEGMAVPPPLERIPLGEPDDRSDVADSRRDPATGKIVWLSKKDGRWYSTARRLPGRG